MDGKFVRLSKAWEAFLGRPRSDLEGISFLEFVHPDDQASTREQMALMENGESVEGFVNRYRVGDGSYREVSWRSQLDRV